MKEAQKLLSPGDRMRLLGAIDGYIHAIVMIKGMIGAETACHINHRHVRKRRERDLKLSMCRDLYLRLEKALRESQGVYKAQAELSDAGRRALQEGE